MVFGPPKPELMQALAQEHKLPFPMIWDERNEVAQKFGVRFKYPQYILDLYASFGIDLAAASGDDSLTLPMPARFVIDKSGIIRNVEVDADYTHRPEPGDIAGIVRGLH